LEQQAATIKVGKSDPPAGSQELGAVSGAHDQDHGDGTYEGAVAKLRLNAAKLGANYVEIMAIVLPHTRKRIDGSYVIQGTAFKVPHAPSRGACDPPCSPGYGCSAGECVPLCNPRCQDGEVCRQARTCGPAH